MTSTIWLWPRHSAANSGPETTVCLTSHLVTTHLCIGLARSMPRVRLAFLADAAQAQPDGKIYALGAGIDTIYAAQFPAVQPSLTVVVKIEFTPAACGRPHAIERLAVDG